MSTKYDASSDSRLVEEDIALTDHAIFRYRQRSPHDLDLDPRVAWRRGEFVEDPGVCQSADHSQPPIAARLYRHTKDWGCVFLVDRDTGPEHIGASQVVVTTNHIRGFDHKPTRAYLRAHDVHGGESA